MKTEIPKATEAQIPGLIEVGIHTMVPTRFQANGHWFKFKPRKGIRVFNIAKDDTVVMSSDHPLATHFEDALTKRDKDLREILLRKCATFQVVKE